MLETEFENSGKAGIKVASGQVDSSRKENE